MFLELQLGFLGPDVGPQLSFTNSTFYFILHATFVMQVS